MSNDNQIEKTKSEMGAESMNNTEILRKRREKAVAKEISMHSIYASRAQNSELWDVDNKRYIDFAAKTRSIL